MSDDAEELITNLTERAGPLGWRGVARVLVRVLDSNGMASDAIDALEMYGDEAIEAETWAGKTRPNIITVQPIKPNIITVQPIKPNIITIKRETT